ILVRSPSVVDGYFDDPEATRKAIVDGWLHTGDAGRFEDDGDLVVLGRVSEVVRTASGERYIPNYIENRLKFSPYIRNVAVIGAGVVGLLAAHLLARIPGVTLTVTDTDPGKARIAAALGLAFAAPAEAPPEAELIVHASGSPDGLALALARAGFEARIVEASWFGDRVVPLALGEAFHSRRLRLISSQVGSIAAPMRGRRSHAERLSLSLALLDDARLDALLDGPTPFADLPATMARLAGSPGALCHVIAYDPSV
ncbi:MAG: hypothetical protein ACK4ST_13475, partial [Elioraea tepidiphila]